MASLATVSVAFRFLARYIKSVSIEADDYLVVVGLVSLSTLMICTNNNLKCRLDPLSRYMCMQYCRWRDWEFWCP